MTTLPPSIETLLPSLLGRLALRANQAGFGELLESAFGISADDAAVISLQAELARGSYSLPSIELRTADELQGALGAYGIETGVIYLSEPFVSANIATPERVLAVLLEEVGHALDARLNPGLDAAGDEGAIFSALIRGQQLSEAELAELRTEHDHTTLLLDGQVVRVERASFTVTNTNDSGAGSLRQAIADANATAGADEITFDPSLNGQTINLTSGQLTITESLTINGDIDGDGTADITLDAGGNSRVLRIDDGDSETLQDVVLTGLVVTGGAVTGGDDGGGIYNHETLTLNNSIVTGNSASGNFSAGGGIRHRYGDLTLNNSTVSNNSVNGNDSRGGGIHFVFGGNLTLNNSTISNNSVTGDGSDGGGINFVLNSGDLVIDNSTISSNSATGDGSEGGGIRILSSNLLVRNSTISGNQADSNGGGNLTTGGGIRSSGTDVTIENSTISNNHTLGSTGGYGGGIFHRYGNLTITNSTISNNSAGGSFGNGGGIYSSPSTGENETTTLINVTLSGNSASLGGGGLFNRVGRTVIQNSTVTNNSAPSGNGSGVASLGSNFTSTEITSSIISGNANNDDVGLSYNTTNSFISNGHNLIGSGNAAAISAFNQPGDITGNTDPGLATLADNGGPTETHALLPTSPALDAGSNPLGLTTDQRGADFTRIVGNAIDIGALEQPDPAPTSGDDILIGTLGDDTIDGLNGSDVINGLQGNDTLIGGPGNDVLNGQEDADLLQGKSGNDTLNGGPGDDSLQGDGGEDTLLGGEGNDDLNGGADNDEIDGGAGDDIANGGNGNDLIRGGDGRDTLNGANGRDTIYGDGGNDLIRGGDGRDTLQGGEGNDNIKGGNTKDFLFGGAGNDRLDGNGGFDELTGGSGNDLLRGFGGDDLLVGVDPTAVNPGAGERDTLLGALGADTFVLGDATNVFYLGGGNADFAKISDFDIAENDLIVLNGSSSDYTLQIAGSTTRLFSTSSGPNDLIATLQGVNIADFSSGFSFI